MLILIILSLFWVLWLRVWVFLKYLAWPIWWVLQWLANGLWFPKFLLTLISLLIQWFVILNKGLAISSGLHHLEGSIISDRRRKPCVADLLLIDWMDKGILSLNCTILLTSSWLNRIGLGCLVLLLVITAVMDGTVDAIGLTSNHVLWLRFIDLVLAILKGWLLNRGLIVTGNVYWSIMVHSFVEINRYIHDIFLLLMMLMMFLEG